MFHPPDGSLHFEQKGGVVAFRSRNSASGIAENVVLPAGVDLGEDGSHPTGLFSSLRLASVMRQKGRSWQGCLTMGAEHGKVCSF